MDFTICPKCRGRAATDCLHCNNGHILCSGCSGIGGYVNFMTGKLEPCVQCCGKGRQRCTNCIGSGRIICDNCYGAGVSHGIMK